MLGLLAYPFAVEPALNLHWQARSWYALYLVFALGLAASAVPLRNLKEAPAGSAEKSGAGAEAADSDLTVSSTVQLLWIALSACASLMFLAVTSQLCEEVAAVPFLWVLPLAVYLLSFIVCFGNPTYYRRAVSTPPSPSRSPQPVPFFSAPTPPSSGR